MIPRFARDLINSVQNSDLKVGITVVQIYKDWMFDLLRGDSDISVGIYFGAIENNRNRDI